MTRHERDCLRLCDEEGLTELRLAHRGRHLAVVHAAGTVFFPCTPSDRRWRRNMRSLVRRVARGAGSPDRG